MRSAPMAFMEARRYSFSAEATRFASAGATSRYSSRCVPGGGAEGAAFWPSAGAIGNSKDTTAIAKRSITSLRFDACEYTQVRLFVAVEIGEALSQQVAKLSGQLQRRAADAAPSAKVTWIPADRMHLTVRFIGEVDDRKASLVRNALEAPLAAGPFSLTLCGVGAFPKGSTPRVVWVPVTEGRDELLAIEREVTSRMTPLGVPEESRA